MIFQLWLRTLINDAVARDKAHIVALLGPHDLRQLYMEGTPPSVESIFGNGEGKVVVKSIRHERKPARRIA